MPADPFRLKVKKAVSEALKTISAADGNRFTLSDYTDEDDGQTRERVFRGREEFGPGDPLPMISVLEDPRQLDVLGSSPDETAQKGPLRLLIQGFVPDSMDHPTDDADHLAADIIEKLVAQKQDKDNILGFGCKMPCITEMKIGQPVVRNADNVVSSVAFCFIALTLTLVEDVENPRASTL
jgi:hypothetical protein